MIRLSNYTLVFFIIINFLNFSLGNEKFFKEGLDFYNAKKYEDARFMFERTIVFNPKDSNAYLYLAKIYNLEEDQENEKKKFRGNTFNRTQ